VERLTYIARERGRLALTGAPNGYDSFLATEAAQRRKGLVLFVAVDDVVLRAGRSGFAISGLGLFAL
jgi:transcription-repair coupling factor (superfamily II helicase)